MCDHRPRLFEHDAAAGRERAATPAGDKRRTDVVLQLFRVIETAEGVRPI
jgi:hypothetical protein